MVLVAAGAAAAFSASAHAERATSYAQSAKILASDGIGFDQFAHSVAIEGGLLVAGAVGEATVGAAYAFERDGFGEWQQVDKLVPGDGGVGDSFGKSVAASGEWIIVGSPHHDEAGLDSGAAYLYKREGGIGGWDLVTKIFAASPELSEGFGVSVDIDDHTAMVGTADGDAAYVFLRDFGGVDNWGLIAELNGLPGDDFGTSVAMDGDWAIVGAPGLQSASIRYRYQDGPNRWGEVAPLAGPLGFGFSVDLSGETAVVGAFFDNDERGSTEVFERDFGEPNAWGRTATLSAPDPAPSDRFGTSVAIDGDTIAVGAYWDDDQGTNSGSAYIFRRDKGGVDNWGKAAKAIPVEGAGHDYFGWSVALSGGTLVVGAYLDDDQDPNSGSAYAFDQIEVDPRLILTGTCPGDVTFDLVDGTPLGSAVLGFSQATGNAALTAGPCTGTVTGLDVINSLGALPIGGDGSASLSATLPFFVCDLVLQVLDSVSCALTDVTTLP